MTKTRWSPPPSLTLTSLLVLLVQLAAVSSDIPPLRKVNRTPRTRDCTDNSKQVRKYGEAFEDCSEKFCIAKNCTDSGIVNAGCFVGGNVRPFSPDIFESADGLMKLRCMMNRGLKPVSCKDSIGKLDYLGLRVDPDGLRRQCSKTGMVIVGCGEHRKHLDLVEEPNGVVTKCTDKGVQSIGCRNFDGLIDMFEMFEERKFTKQCDRDGIKYLGCSNYDHSVVADFGKQFLDGENNDVVRECTQEGRVITLGCKPNPHHTADPYPLNWAWTEEPKWKKCTLKGVVVVGCAYKGRLIQLDDSFDDGEYQRICTTEAFIDTLGCRTDSGKVQEVGTSFVDGAKWKKCTAAGLETIGCATANGKTYAYGEEFDDGEFRKKCSEEHDGGTAANVGVNYKGEQRPFDVPFRDGDFSVVFHQDGKLKQLGCYSDQHQLVQFGEKFIEDGLYKRCNKEGKLVIGCVYKGEGKEYGQKFGEGKVEKHCSREHPGFVEPLKCKTKAGEKRIGEVYKSRKGNLRKCTAEGIVGPTEEEIAKYKAENPEPKPATDDDGTSSGQGAHNGHSGADGESTNHGSHNPDGSATGQDGSSGANGGESGDGQQGSHNGGTSGHGQGKHTKPEPKYKKKRPSPLQIPPRNGWDSSDDGEGGIGKANQWPTPDGLPPWESQASATGEAHGSEGHKETTDTDGEGQEGEDSGHVGPGSGDGSDSNNSEKNGNESNGKDPANGSGSNDGGHGGKGSHHSGQNEGSNGSDDGKTGGQGHGQGKGQGHGQGLDGSHENSGHTGKGHGGGSQESGSNNEDGSGNDGSKHGSHGQGHGQGQGHSQSHGQGHHGGQNGSDDSGVNGGSGSNGSGSGSGSGSNGNGNSGADASASSATGWQRTAIMIKGKDYLPHFIRGGVSHRMRDGIKGLSITYVAPRQVLQAFKDGTASAARRPLGCEFVLPMDNNPCAIPIVHKTQTENTAYRAWSTKDRFLDWVGAEKGQGVNKIGAAEIGARGTPMILTSDDRTDRKTYYYLNHYGPGYWLVEFDMDCSKTENGWFEFKAYKQMWENDIQQTECIVDDGVQHAQGESKIKVPYKSNNHVALCGHINRYFYGENFCHISSFPRHKALFQYMEESGPLGGLIDKESNPNWYKSGAKPQEPEKKKSHFFSKMKNKIKDTF